MRAISKSTDGTADTSAVQQAQYFLVPALAFYVSTASAIDLNATTYANYSLVTVYNSSGGTITNIATGGTVSQSGDVATVATNTFARTSAVNWARLS